MSGRKEEETQLVLKKEYKDKDLHTKKIELEEKREQLKSLLDKL